MSIEAIAIIENVEDEISSPFALSITIVSLPEMTIKQILALALALACAAAPVAALMAPRSSPVKTCVEINQCVGCTRQFFTKSSLGDDAAVLAPSSGDEPASPRHRAGERAIKF